MERLLKLLDDTSNVIICNNHIKTYILKYGQNKLLKACIKDYADIQNDLYSQVTLNDLWSQQNNIIDVRKIKLQNSLLVFENSENSTLKELYELHQKHNYHFNNQHLEFYNKKNLYFINYDFDDDIVNLIIKKLKNVQFMEFNYEYKHQVLMFDQCFDEIAYVVNDIAKKIINNCSLDKIIIHNVNEDYIAIFKQLFALYHIPYQTNEDIMLNEIEEIKVFLNYLNNHFDEKIYDVLMQYKKLHPLSENLLVAYKIVNEIMMIEENLNQETFNIIKYQIKNQKYKKSKKNNVIRFENIFDHLYTDDEYIYLLNFAQNVIPAIHKDDQYICDELRKEIGLITSYERNIAEQNKVIRAINSIKNLNISFGENLNKTKYVENVLINNEKLINKIQIVRAELQIEDIVCEKLAKLRFLKANEMFITYNEQSNDFIKGFHYFKNLINFYDSDCKSINKNILNNYLNNCIISFTGLDDYFKCAFRFYLKYLLKVSTSKDNEKNNINILVGNIFHYVLENYITDKYIKKICLEKDYIKNLITTYLHHHEIIQNFRIKTYLEIYEEYIYLIIERIDKFHQNSKFNVYDVEKECKLYFDNFILKGKIDKILKYDNYYFLIDYKTYLPNIDLSNLDQGLDLQLPIYMLFIKTLDEQAKFAGICKECILQSSPFRYDNKKTFDEIYLKTTRYIGYFNDNVDIIKKLDELYNSEDRILPTNPFTSKGQISKIFLKHCLTDENFEKIISYTKALIMKTFNKIQNGRFKLNPFILGESSSCDDCPYRSICYVDNENIKFKNKHKDLNWLLGGGENGVE